MIGEPVLRMCGGSDSACIDVRLNGKSRPIKFVKVLKAALGFQVLERPTDRSVSQSIAIYKLRPRRAPPTPAHEAAVDLCGQPIDLALVLNRRVAHLVEGDARSPPPSRRIVLPILPRIRVEHVAAALDERRQMPTRRLDGFAAAAAAATLAIAAATTTAAGLLVAYAAAIHKPICERGSCGG